MKWWKKVADKWKKFIAETAKANDQMWKGQAPSCCKKENYFDRSRKFYIQDDYISLSR